MKKAPKKTHVIRQLKFRIPEALRARAAESAEKAGVSLNRELIRRVEESFANDRLQETIKTVAESSATTTAKNMIGELLQVMHNYELTRKSGG